MTITARRYQLSRRPVGLPVEADFEIVEVELPAPAAGELLVENLCFSVDAYHREAMEAGGPWQLHEPMEGRTIGRVLASGIDAVSPDDLVFHRQAYATHALVTDYRALTVAEASRSLPTSAFSAAPA